ncbi:histidine phosphatase family protein [Vibrio ordalii]|uniref:histidine phosphatase family protein n=1 Tax=Vibrio ordalii TaxID=28174 RepID=UPI0025761F24|nr:histidine phosphatase family protein [Vibrio ordalii]MCS0351783.1 histidine phosphatase family protein [Vibrio ordalii]
MINLYLMRHGKTVGRPALNGKTDVLVEAHRQEQIAHTLLRSRYSFSNIITSPLRRCHDLAQQLVLQQPKLDYQIEPDFQEMDFGDVDGVAFDELQSMWPVVETLWTNPAQHQLPNAENLVDFHQRVTRAWEARVKEIKQDTLIIAHGGTIRMILAYVLGTDWQNPHWYSVLNIEYQSLTHIQIGKDNAKNVTVKSIGIQI